MPTTADVTISLSLRERMQSARNVLVLTGAGISAESGVPTFRGGGNTTIWKGMPFDVISSARMLQTNLPAVWEWFNYRRRLLAALKPNAGHLALARWHDRFDDFTLVTQNVDNLHQLGGSREVTELHGNIWRARCVECSTRYNLFENEVVGDFKEHEVDESDEELPPAPICEACGNSLRPDVVLFGELLPPGVFERATEKAQQCELCFVVGTSALVYPAASLPEIAAGAGAYIVEVNPERTPLSDLCDEVIMGKAGEVLPLL